MSQDSKRNRWPNVVVGLILIGVGVWFVYQIFYRGIMSITSDPKSLVFISGPTLLFFGSIILIRGIVFAKKAFSGRTVLYSGLLMFIVGIYPDVYLPLLLGGKEEAVQQLGLFVRITTGYPGIVLSVIGFFIRNLNKD